MGRWSRTGNICWSIWSTVIICPGDWNRGDQEFPLRFGLFSLRLLAALRQMTLEETGELTLADRVEWLRRWSAELEYSEENLERLAEYFLYL